MKIPGKKEFEAHADEAFNISFNGSDALECRIDEIKVSSTPMVGQQEKQFSVIFAHPKPEVYNQGVYKICNQNLGEFELFLVPIFGDAQSVHYEAIFT